MLFYLNIKEVKIRRNREVGLEAIVGTVKMILISQIKKDKSLDQEIEMIFRGLRVKRKINLWKR